MKPTTLLLIIVVALTVAAPTVSASHSGPTCTHEYVDHYKQPVETAQACLRATGNWLSDWLGVMITWP